MSRILLVGLLCCFALLMVTIGASVTQQNQRHVATYLHTDLVASGAPQTSLASIWRYKPSERWPHQELYKDAVRNYNQGNEDQAFDILAGIPDFGCLVISTGNDVYAQTGFDAAASLYERTLALSTGGCQLGTLLQMSRNLCRESANHPESLGKLGESDWCARSIELLPSFVTYSDMGRSLYGAGSYDLATSAFQQAIDLNKESPEGYMWLGRSQMRRGNLEEAQAAFEHGLSLSPRHSGINYEMGRLKRNTRDIEDAVCYFSVAASDDTIFGEAARRALSEMGTGEMGDTECEMPMLEGGE